MKRFLLFFVLVAAAFCGSEVQNVKKVSVWDTKCPDQSLTPTQMLMVRGGMETSVGNARGYEVFDRSAFDIILKEHHFERSGAVNDAEIKEMGKIAGVQYVIVPEASVSGNDFYIIVKMLDVETGKFGGVYDALCTPSGTDIRRSCGELGAKLFGSAAAVKNSISQVGGGSAVQGRDFSETAYGINMRMIYVEGGTFNMGCTSEQSDCENDESPMRTTMVGSFHIGMLEVTQAQWEKVMGTSVDQQRDKADPDGPMAGVGADYPMYYVHWEEAKEFCARLSRQTGRNYSLPTEAEWEYAARGGSRKEGTMYSGGRNIDGVAWYTENSGSSTHPCGTKRPNALGIYDMSGNVYEWCEDRYGNYISNDNNNPKGAASGSNHVLRGGSWGVDAMRCRVSYRGYNSSGTRSTNGGFRVVLR